MTYPGPTLRRQRLTGHSEAEMLELQARAGVHAGLLPTNRVGHTDLDGMTGAPVTSEQSQRGWTAQQPWGHVDCPVLHVCVLCAEYIDPDHLRQHVCAVALELAHAA